MTSWILSSSRAKSIKFLFRDVDLLKIKVLVLGNEWLLCTLGKHYHSQRERRSYPLGIMNTNIPDQLFDQLPLQVTDHPVPEALVVFGAFHTLLLHLLIEAT